MRSSVRLALLGGYALLAACHHSSDDPPQQSTPPPPGSPPVGLDARPSNTTCVAPAKSSGGAGATIALQRVFANLTFTQPLAMLQAPGDDSRWYVLEKTGRVRTFADTANVASATTALTLTVNSNSEGGLLGLAFHPGFAANRLVYVSFTE
ncbi:MAG TPA: PQQ-dependent sugar dehydrogenase, partial [Gammaproteobacteria bacterium]|nr:PQQ-dependent sugar dehydrogenase [Gammaproteobacteria bacterium]